MKNIYLLFVLLLICSIQGISQSNADCTPDFDVSLDELLIDPLPSLSEDDSLGINKTVIIGQPFEFTWTVVFPSKFTAPVVFLEADADSIRFLLDSTLVIFEGDTTLQLPEGLTLEMNPGSGLILPNDEIPGACIRLSGTPTENVKPGTYSLVFNTFNCLRIPGVFVGCMQAYIPSIISGFAGEYKLEIKQDESSSVPVLNKEYNLKSWPNPASGEFNIKVEDIDLGRSLNFSLYNLQGQQFQVSTTMRKNKNETFIKAELSHLPQSMYIYKIETNEGIFTGKLFIHQ